MARALILGGNGAIGRAAALRLASAGWQVDITGRDAAHLPPELAELPGVAFLRSDRRDAAALAAAIGDGADLVVDLLCGTEAEARMLLPHLGDLAGLVMLSSKAVYVDEFGNHANSLTRPVFPLPIREGDRTVAPGRADPGTRDGYAAAKVAAEHTLLDSGAPVTVLRASKVHGVGAARPREWAFARRALDGREQLLLAHGGRGGEHTSAAANLAALIETVAGVPGARILNAADPDHPNGLEIAQTVAAHLGHRFEPVLLDDDVDPQHGAHPWDVVPPVVLDLAAAEALGYEPVGDFAATVADELDWLRGLHERGETARFDDDPFFAPYLDYRLEDAYLLLRSLSS